VYAPELNRIERVWHCLQDKLSHPRGWADLPALAHATGSLLDRIDARFHRPEGITVLLRNTYLAQFTVP
jgi:hypothetical protein